MIKPPFVLLDHGGPGGSSGGHQSLLIEEPDTLIVAYGKADIAAALDAVDQAVEAGNTVAGFTAFEVAGFFEPKLSHLLDQPQNHPLIWYAVSDTPRYLTQQQVADWLSGFEAGSPRRAEISFEEPDDLESWFKKAFQATQDYIHAGDVFQINLTYQNSVAVEGHLPSLYRRLRTAQPAPFSAYIDTGDQVILSLSPEQFIKREGHRLTAKPMKGTARRGRWTTEDRAIAENLRQDPKTRAENLMIVDLMRNDLSRIATKASVKVPTLFDVEQYPTVHQMTSTIEATAKQGVMPSDVLQAVFPCGSVTGAPKIRAQEIIADLENGPRGIYCGTIGRFTGTEADADWSMNVPIRTLCLTDVDRPNGTAKGTLAVGAGLVADSEELAELAECRLKAQFAVDRSPSPMVRSNEPPNLIESLRLDVGANDSFDYPLLEQHLSRLGSSADYFQYPFDRGASISALNDIAQAAPNTASAYKVRLLLSPSGDIACSMSPISDTKGMRTRLAVASTRLDPRDIWLYHKTRNRLLYDRALKAAQKAGFDDLLFLNITGEVCESSIFSVFAKEQDGSMLTPPIRNGLLPSVLRESLINSGKATESQFTLDTLQQSDGFWVGNAVRGLLPAELVLDSSGRPVEVEIER